MGHAEGKAGQGQLPIVVIKRRGGVAAGEGYVVLRLSTLLRWWPGE